MRKAAVLSVLLVIVAVFAPNFMVTPTAHRDRSRIILTFDDGAPGWDGDQAVPIMKEFGYVGVAALVIMHFSWMPKGIFYTLLSRGWELASHSWNHLDLRTLNYQQKYFEIIKSKSWIESTFRTEVVTFAYPFSTGATDSDVLNLLSQGGYKYAREYDNFHGWSGQPGFQIDSYFICQENYLTTIRTAIEESREHGIAVLMFHRVNPMLTGYGSLAPEAFRYCLQQIRNNRIEVVTFAGLSTGKLPRYHFL